jgi:ABC-type Co2+ transport system permease subunit
MHAHVICNMPRKSFSANTAVHCHIPVKNCVSSKALGITLLQVLPALLLVKIAWQSTAMSCVSLLATSASTTTCANAQRKCKLKQSLSSICLRVRLGFSMKRSWNLVLRSAYLRNPTAYIALCVQDVMHSSMMLSSNCLSNLADHLPRTTI